jgi:hypothetical protein
MTLRAPLVRISGKIVDLPASDTIGGAPAGPTGADGSAPLTTKGDLLTFSTVVTALGVGADGTVLTADSAQARGIKWGTVTAGVSSVSNSDSTLTISPTTGAVVASLNLGHANTWTAKQTFRASTTSASTAGIYLQSGTLMSTAEVGAVEFLTDKFYATITTGAVRKELALNDAALTSGRVPVVTTNGRLTDSANLTFDIANNRFNLFGAVSTAGNDFYAQKTQNSQFSSYFQNSSTGTTATSVVAVFNSADYCGIFKYSSGFTTVGLLTANAGALFTGTGNLLVGPLAAAATVFVTVGTATANERMRVDSSGITIADAHNIVVNTSTGTKIGTGTTQKLGFWNATPVAQKTGYGTPTGNVNQGSFAAGSITLPNLAAGVAQLILDLKAIGIIGA